MNLSDTITIPAPRALVYAALQDPAVLSRCIPGCEELVRTSESELEAKVVLKVGPVKARFAGKVTLNPESPPERFTLTGEGSGGVAGFAKGGATVTLEEVGGETVLTYEARADIGGKLAQLGSRLLQGTATKLAAAFFDDFRTAVTEAPAEA